MSKEQINKRVLIALGVVLDTHKELTKTAFAQLLGVKPSTFTEILKGRMNAGSDLMALLTSNYGVSATWMLIGTGEMFVNDEQLKQNTNCGEPMADKLLGIIDKKDDTIRQQAECIGKLRAENEQLKGRLQKSAAGAHTVPTANAV